MTDSASRDRRQGGYVLLIVLVIAAMGMAAALAAFGLAETSGRVAAADGAAEKALFAARAGVSDAADRLVWGGLAGLWTGDTYASFVVQPGESCSASVAVHRASASVGGAGVFAVTARGVSGAATATVHSTLTVEPRGLPRGITVAGSLRAGAKLSVSGCGVYAGGDVYGREHVEFCDAVGGGAGQDGALPEAWTVAAVHAAGHIYAAGVDVHEGPAAGDGDTDACTGEATAQDPWPPSAEALAVLGAHAVDDSLLPAGGRIDLAQLATRLSAHQATLPQTGALVVVHGGDDAVVVEGWWPQTPDDPQVTLLVVGDAVIAEGGEGAGAAVRGSLLVTGILRISTPTLVVGHVAAGGLEVEAPLSVVLPSAWRNEPPPGSMTAEETVAEAATGRLQKASAHAPQRAAGRRSAVVDGEGKTHPGERCPNDACGCPQRPGAHSCGRRARVARRARACGRVVRSGYNGNRAMRQRRGSPTIRATGGMRKSKAFLQSCRSRRRHGEGAERARCLKQVLPA